MFDRLKRSCDLVKASTKLLKKDTHLLCFPLMSGVASLVIVVCFALPVFGMAGFDFIGENQIALYAAGFLFYVTQYFIIFYFNVALVGAAMFRMDGGSPTLGDGLRIANGRLGAIFGYAVIAATVGVVLRMIQERVGFLGRIIVGMLGVGWTVATFLVVPILVARSEGPVKSIKESALLLQETWGQNVIGQAGMGLFFGLLQMAVVLTCVALAGAGAYVGSPFLVALAIVVAVFAILASVVVHGALNGIYAAALYRFAADGNSSRGFNKDSLQAAFAAK